MNRVLVVGSFDNLNAYHMRLLQEAAGLGSVHVLLWSDEVIRSMEGRTPKFPQEERKYFIEAVRYVDDLSMVVSPVDRNAIPAQYATASAIWVVDQSNDSPAKRAFCDVHRMRYHVLEEAELQGYPEPTCDDAIGGSHDQKKVIVTGCYDWFHTGHVRFFEEVAQLGDLYVVVGHDDNIRLLKGEGHPMCSEDMRRYMAGSIRRVKKALVSSGHGWLDAEPEIELIQPDIYAVNEDGDQPEKRKYCEEHGIEYQILKRLPKEGLPIRRSTDLRGF